VPLTVALQEFITQDTIRQDLLFLTTVQVLDDQDILDIKGLLLATIDHLDIKIDAHMEEEEDEPECH